MNEYTIVLLKGLAITPTSMDDFDGNSVPSYHCGNTDDTYSMGIDDGRVSLAREILKMENIDYAKNDNKK
jgi:hypothetical protein